MKGKAKYRRSKSNVTNQRGKRKEKRKRLTFVRLRRGEDFAVFLLDFFDIVLYFLYHLSYLLHLERKEQRPDQFRGNVDDDEERLK